MELYNYFRSSASYRVRIALALKGLAYDYKAVHLAKNEQFAESYAAVSASRLVPLLRDGDRCSRSRWRSSSTSTKHIPQPPLLPADAPGRARVRALALDMACEIHPLNNLRVLRYLVQIAEGPKRTRTAGTATGSRPGWRRWSGSSAAQPARFCHGDTPTLADCVLVPQIFNAQRFNCRTEHVPQVMRVFEACMRLEAFEKTRPEACPDAF